MSEIDVALLMPNTEPEDFERFANRYGPLFTEMDMRDLTVGWINGHASVQPDSETADISLLALDDDGKLEWDAPSRQALPAVIRDLTLPADGRKPLYDISRRFINNPDVNDFLRHNSKIYDLLPDLHPEKVVVPSVDNVAGHMKFIRGNRVLVRPEYSRDNDPVYAGPKSEVVRQVEGADKPILGGIMIEQSVDTSCGIEELGVRGEHNLRIHVVGQRAVHAALSQPIDGKMKIMRFFAPEELPQSSLTVMQRVLEVVNALPEGADSIFAIDMARTVTDSGDTADLIDRVRVKPLRPNHRELDKAEAALIQRVVRAA